MIARDVAEFPGVSDMAPQLRDVLDAQRVIAPYLDETPSRRYPPLDRTVGAELFVKHENHQPTGAFKVRGGINLVALPSSEKLTAGVYAASTGTGGRRQRSRRCLHRRESGRSADSGDRRAVRRRAGRLSRVAGASTSRG